MILYYMGCGQGDHPGRICRYSVLSEVGQGGVDDMLLVRFGEAVVEGQADEPVALAGGVDVLAVEAAEFEAGGRGVQGDVVEDGDDAVVLEVLDEGRAVLQVPKLELVHVGVVDAALRDGGDFDAARLCEGREGL